MGTVFKPYKRLGKNHLSFSLVLQNTKVSNCSFYTDHPLYSVSAGVLTTAGLLHFRNAHSRAWMCVG